MASSSSVLPAPAAAVEWKPFVSGVLSGITKVVVGRECLHSARVLYNNTDTLSAEPFDMVKVRSMSLQEVQQEQQTTDGRPFRSAMLASWYISRAMGLLEANSRERRSSSAV